MKNSKGISLIALIITIIVIIILAAIVIGGIFNTPNDAKFATFCQEYDRVQSAIQIKYYDLYQKYALQVSTEIPTHYEIYNEIATGEPADEKTGESNIDSDNWVEIASTQWGTAKNQLCAEPSIGGNWYIRLNDGKLACQGFEKGEQDMYYTPIAHIIGDRTPKNDVYFNSLTGITAADNSTRSGLSTLLLSGIEPLLPLGENEAYLADKVKVGDYVKYTPRENGEYEPETAKTGNASTTKLTQTSGIKWRVWDVNEDNGIVRLISDEPTNYDADHGNKLILSTFANSHGTGGAIHGANAYTNAVSVINKACSDIYGSDKAIKVESLTYEDIEEKVAKYNGLMPVIAEKHYAYYLNDTDCVVDETEEITKASDNQKITYVKKIANKKLTNSISASRFYTYDTDGITYDGSQSTPNIGVDYKKPTIVNEKGKPVYVTETYSDGAIDWGDGNPWKDILLGSSDKYYWLASTCVNLRDDFVRLLCA